MKYLIQLLLHAGAATAPTLAFAPLILAQSSGRPPRNDTLQLEIRRITERELLERAITEPPKSTGRPSLNLAAFKADFIGLQVVNNKLLKASSIDPLDVNSVGKSAREIRKIARRLKANLVLPKSGDASKGPTTVADLELEQFRPTLSTLDQLVVGFVSNPVFESAKVVDTQLSAKARNDLDRIIELSGVLRKSSEKLRQAGVKSQ